MAASALAYSRLGIDALIRFGSGVACGQGTGQRWVNGHTTETVERWEAEREAPIAKEKPQRALYGKTDELRTGIGMFYTRKETPRDL